MHSLCAFALLLLAPSAAAAVSGFSLQQRLFGLSPQADTQDAHLYSDNSDVTDALSYADADEAPLDWQHDALDAEPAVVRDLWSSLEPLSTDESLDEQLDSDEADDTDDADEVSSDSVAVGHQTDTRFMVNLSAAPSPQAKAQMLSQQIQSKLVNAAPQGPVGQWLRGLFTGLLQLTQKPAGLNAWQMRWTVGHLLGDMNARELGIKPAQGQGSNDLQGQLQRARQAVQQSMGRGPGKGYTAIRAVFAKALQTFPTSGYNAAVGVQTLHHITDDIASGDLGFKTRD